jgi:(p)ppGpp synthase/HD superfamily hydrolase
MSLLERAICIAARAHEGQLDKAGAPYILHALRVMLAMSCDEERIVAVLHDVIEDTSYTFESLKAEGFSAKIINAIDGLTRRSDETYDDFILRVRTNSIARRVKLADLADNSDLTRFRTPLQEDRDRTLKYRRALVTLADAPDKATKSRSE